MELNILSGFEEFKNTKLGKKLGDCGNEREPQIKFRKVKDAQNKVYVQVVLNKSLNRILKDNKIFTFKLLFNEETKAVAIKYDNSSSAFSIVGKRTRSNGDYCFQDKYITANILPLFNETQCIIYNLKCDKDKLIYIFKKQ